ncbi:MAG TPA: exodeoxyribonuclease VII large subunit [Candidatus Acidoferrum sp.]|nr:exodeoxyribonuclease VII large subunit [Candidatus Acidoferrum sp.]
MSDTEPPDWALPAWDADLGSSRAARGQAVQSASSPVPAPPGTFGLRILAVSDVTRAVRDAIREDERLRDVWVEGEVGRVTISSAGHGYFNLKDEHSQLSCIWFRDDRMSSPFEARVGLRVVAHGRLDVFEPGGVYQLYVSAIQPAGFGDLAIRFEALKARLSAEGLFDVARKRPLPTRPAVIGVVTSPTGAVWHDIRRVLERRWPLARVVVSPCLVQGDGAPASIARALGRIDRWAERVTAAGRPEDAPAVTIVARGGGSLEDLWAFNDEAVVRAVAGHGRPVVSGVGHETDVTLTDFAADVRAPTPSAAAELVVPDAADIADGLARLRVRGRTAVDRRLAATDIRLTHERRTLAQLHPAAQLAAALERSGRLLDRATTAIATRLDRAATRVARVSGIAPMLVGARLDADAGRLGAAAAALGALGPQATLDRGYAIVRLATDDRIVRDPADAPAGSRLHVRVARGELDATVATPSVERRAGPETTSRGDDS